MLGFLYNRHHHKHGRSHFGIHGRHGPGPCRKGGIGLEPAGQRAQAREMDPKVSGGPERCHLCKNNCLLLDPACPKGAALALGKHQPGLHKETDHDA